MSLPVLYSFRRCPYAMRARMSIVREGYEVELREVVLQRPSRPHDGDFTQGHGARALAARRYGHRGEP